MWKAGKDRKDSPTQNTAVMSGEIDGWKEGLKIPVGRRTDKDGREKSGQA